MPTYRHGRHEHGQNFLRDTSIQHAIVEHVRATTGPILEIGPGTGTLTTRLAELGRPLTAVEADGQLVNRLQQHVDSRVEIVHGDFLRYGLPDHAHVLVGCLPFHLTTAILRHILRAPGWTHAVVVMQWEVARRRAGVGGATLMTAQWGPWFTFDLGQRVPARAFRPAPNVDGGLLIMTRREQPLLSMPHRKQFRTMAHRVFTGRGRGIADIATRAGLFTGIAQAREWANSVGLRPHAQPRELTAEQWVNLYRACRT